MTHVTATLEAKEPRPKCRGCGVPIKEAVEIVFCRTCCDRIVARVAAEAAAIRQRRAVRKR